MKMKELLPLEMYTFTENATFSSIRYDYISEDTRIMPQSCKFTLQIHTRKKGELQKTKH